mmetsp:Transcript_18477/g.49572  ORF Transcript_18477/g.49572 Transcript_18477/m.49572 type:complete len:211 (+) Transcript_18477:65-697(+)
MATLGPAGGLGGSAMEPWCTSGAPGSGRPWKRAWAGCRDTGKLAGTPCWRTALCRVCCHCAAGEAETDDPSAAGEIAAGGLAAGDVAVGDVGCVSPAADPCHLHGLDLSFASSSAVASSGAPPRSQGWRRASATLVRRSGSGCTRPSMKSLGPGGQSRSGPSNSDWTSRALKACQYGSSASGSQVARRGCPVRSVNAHQPRHQASTLVAK